MALRINSIPKDVFAYRVNEDDQKIGTGKNAISRNKIIASGRLCTVETLGSALGTKDKPYKSRINEFGGDLAAFGKAHMDQKLIFCAARAYESMGMSAPESADQVRDPNNTIWKDPVFLRTMAAIDKEIIAPLLYDVIGDLNGMILDMEQVNMGSTKELVIQSAEAFIWEDGAVGASHSASRNYLYNDVVTLTPKAYHCAGRIKWYQDVVNDDGRGAGRYYLAIIRGLQNKISAITAQAFKSAVAQNSGLVPPYLYFQGYSSANWAAAREAVMAANGFQNPGALMGVGRITPLKAVIPSGTAVDAALTYGLGNEWMKSGFVSMADGVPLYEVLPAMVPGTSATTGDLIGLPNDQLYVMARSGYGRAPIQGVIARGWPIDLTYTAEQTADFEIYINMTTLMDIKPAFASRIAVIDGVTLSGT